MNRFWGRAVLVGALLAAPAVPGARRFEAPAPPARPVAEAATSEVALAVARRQGSDVVAADLTTETRLVRAHPDGTMSADVANRPVRTARGGRWRDIDPTLVRRPDGTVAPTATIVDVAFSGGGPAKPLMVMRVAGGSVAYHWPGVLPAPRLDGPVATYADVLPGVDLTMRAEATGYAKRLVVRTAAAAKNPALRALRLRISVHKLKVGVTTEGGTEIRDPAGKLVLAGPPAVMWDDAGSSVDGPGEGARTARVKLSVRGTTLSLVPATGFLSDPATRFPVVIDPSEHLAGRGDWAVVFSGYRNDSYWYGDGEGVGKVGACPVLFGGVCNGIGVARTYYSFDTSFLAGRQIIEPENTKISIDTTHGTDCAARSHALYRYDGDIWNGMTWDSQPPLSRVAATGVGCTGDAVWNIGSSIQLGGHTSYAVIADNEATDRDGQLSWRKYGNAAWLRVKFNTPPNHPEDVRVQPGLPAPCRWCAGKSWISAGSIDLQAYLTDPDQQEALSALWRVTHNGTGQDVTTGGLGSGSWHTLRQSLAEWDGQEISWSVAARDAAGSESGRRQGPGPFVVDRTGPAAAPTVAAKLYPADNRWHGGVGVAGDFTFTAGGVADVDHYLYGFSDPPNTPVDATALGGGATVTLTPPGDGPRDLYVQSVDRAGNLGPRTVHRFYVRAGNGPVAQWSFEGDARDSAFLGWRDGTLLGGAGYVPGAVGTAVGLDGKAGRVAVTDGLRTDIGFSVSAWAKLDNLTATTATVVSQSGTNTVAYSIQYEKSSGKWVFVLPQTDSEIPPGYTFVRSTAPAVAGQWTHLAGVYDVQQKKILFYVNGILAGSTAHDPTWTGSGYLRIGYQEIAGQLRGHLPGTIDEVKLYDRVLSATEVRAQVSHDNVQLGYWKFDDEAGSRTAVNAVAGGAAGVLNGGAELVPGQVNGAVRLDGPDDYVTTGGPAVRTDQSFTLAGWLTASRTPAPAGIATALSQDGTAFSGFQVGYRNVDGGVWELHLPSADAVSRPGDTVVRSAPGTAVAGRAAHVAAVYDAATGQARLYVDGQLAGSAARTGGFDAAGAFRVGGGLWEGVRGNPWHGTVDEVRAYNRVLAAEEVQGLVSRDSVAVARWGFDGNLAATPGAFDGRDTGHPVSYAAGQSTLPEPNDLAVRLDGSAGYVSAAHAVDTTRSFSVAAWARLDKVGGNPTVVSQDGSRIRSFQLSATPEGKWAFTVAGADADANADDYRVTGPTVQVGSWAHLAATYNAAARRIELYVNGVLAGSRDDARVFGHATGELQIGAAKRAGDITDLFAGAVDDVSVWSRPLVGEEIKQMAGRDLSLAHQWRLDEPSGGNTADAVGTRSGTLAGDARFAVGRVGNGVHLDGAGDAVTTTGVDIPTDKAFTVTAWVRLSSAECDFSEHAECTADAVTVDGEKTSKFRLGHRIDNDQYQWGAWFFELPESDAADAVVTKASLVTRLEELDTWVHLTGVYDPATRMAVLYVDAGRHDVGTVNNAWRASGGLAIGRGRIAGRTAEYFDGDVDDVRLYTGALDAQRIAALRAAYPAEEGPVTVPAPDAGHWKYDENTGTSLADASGQGRTATLRGGVTWVGGRDAYGVLLDGTSGYAETATAALDTTRDFTAAAWVYPTTTDSTNRTVLGQDGKRVSSFQLRYDGASRKWAVVLPRTDADNPESLILLSGEAVVAGEWAHLALTYDASLAQVRLYVNGMLSAAQVGVGVLPSAGPVSMGRGRWNGGPTGYFARGIDDVRLYRKVLSGGQVRRLHDQAADVAFGSYRFDDGTTRDYSWRKNDATASGGAASGPGISGTALTLDGLNGEAVAGSPGVSMRDSFSVSAWAYLTRNDRTATIVSQEGSRNSGFVLQYRTGLNRWAFGQAAADSDGAPMLYAAAQQAPVLNQWTHVTGVYDYTARQLRIYVDGQLAGTRDDTLLWPGTGNLVLGRSRYQGAKAQYFTGSIDEVRVGYGLPADSRLAIRGGWPLPPAGQLGRYVNAAGERYTAGTGERPPDGYHFDGVLGRAAKAGPHTTMLYSCRSGDDHFSSTDSTCEGGTKLGETGLIYPQAPANIPTVALYRCVRGTDRYDTRLNTCGGTLLGHAVGYAALSRYYHDDDAEHQSTVNATPPGYRFEGSQGYLALTPVAGTVTLYGCQEGVDQFPSTDATCGGRTVLGQLGAIWSQAPPGADSRPLYRCAVNGQRFTSGSATCEGFTVEALLGHVLVTPPTTTAEFPS